MATHGTDYKSGNQLSDSNNIYSMDSITIKTLFCSKERFIIPEYQRAYSWSKPQREQLIQDLRDTKNNYYLGHYLFEKRQGVPDTYFIIDGQQRMTTIVIFVSCMIHALKNRQDSDVNVNALYRQFLYDTSDAQKFHTVSYDDDFFREEIVNRDNRIEGEEDQFDDEKLFDSSSKRHIRHCREYFDAIFADTPTEELKRWLELVCQSKATFFEVEHKEDAAQIFAFQNDRGKALTNLEVLKSFFMLQIYMRGGGKQADYINSLEEAFRRIYREIVKLRTSEDFILRYFWIAFEKRGFNTEDPLKEIKNHFRDLDIDYLISFINKLAQTFVYVSEVERSNENNLVNLKRLNNLAWSLPVLIKAKVIAHSTDETMTALTRLLENFTFRAMVRGGRASVESRLNKLLINADNNNLVLSNIYDFIDEMQYDYWNDNQFREALNNGYIYNRRNACSYLLWRYEETLYGKGYSCKLYSIEKESLEHIAPQHPKDEALANGYGEYNNAEDASLGIESGEWLSSIGNILLVSASHNSSLGNNNFKDKLADYSKSNLMMQQKELVEQFKDVENPVWDKACIEARGKRIIDKAMEIWDLKRIMPMRNPLF